VSDTERTAIMLANRVLRTLSNVALATADQREDREVAIHLHEQARQEWDRWRNGSSFFLGPVWSAGAVGALDYLQHRSNL
jgi:hypothetical protein